MKTAIVLLNLGGPDRLSAVRPFLYNLFSDRDIIPLGPPFLQRPIAFFISLFRAPKTRAAYKLIGGGSPILKITTEQAELLSKSLDGMPVYVGMRYWRPFIEEAVRGAKEQGVERLIGLSLYPHYSRATTGSTKRVFLEAARRYGIEAEMIDKWYDHPLYIDALVDLIYRQLNWADVLLFSAHSLPESFIKEGDPYLDHILGSIRAIMEKIKQERAAPSYMLSFQSRSGPVKWLEPSTDEAIKELARKGAKNILVVPISFVSDHIETLYEIDILYKEMAEREGVTLHRVDSLNTHPLFIEALADLVRKRLQPPQRVP
ncbi:MAG: ferrochelatase [Nitrospirae bacterium]|nr:MAG: ferrochelatase [Nitrospirota bacterium]